MAAKKLYTYSKVFSDMQIEEVVKARENNLALSWAELADRFNKKWSLNNSPDVYRGLHRRFGSNIAEVIRIRNTPHPHADFTREALGDIVKVNSSKRKRFFVTGVCAGAQVHEKAFEAVQNYCDKMEASLVLLPVRSHVKALQDQPLHYDPILKEKGFKKFFATEFVFNIHLKALELQVNPQQISPLTSLYRIRGRANEVAADEVQFEELLKKHRRISILVAHTKQDMEVLPTGHESLPRILQATGVITKPDYLRDSKMGLMAHEDHVLGGIIVEVVGEIFHFRQVQFNPRNGSFVDLSQRFHADGKKTYERAEAFVMGDIHPGHHNETALGAWAELATETKPRRLFLHDWYDGSSTSPWNKKKKFSRATLPPLFKNVKIELEMAHKVLYDTLDRFPKDCVSYLVDSNHPEFVNRWLEDGAYVNDSIPENYEMGHRFIVDKLDGIDPLKKHIDPKDRMVWLESEQDLFIEGVQCAAHGHIGLSGAKGNKTSNEKIHVEAMVGHEHRPGIKHGLYVVGHSSDPRHGYNRGASDWLWCSGLIYKGGHKQLIVTIDGSYKL